MNMSLGVGIKNTNRLIDTDFEKSKIEKLLNKLLQDMLELITTWFDTWYSNLSTRRDFELSLKNSEKTHSVLNV